jgi:hypothetical protein
MNTRPARIDRAALMARARSLAIPVHSCVTARIRPDHLIGREAASRDELAALVILLAEAADPARLRAVVEAVEDELPAVDEAARLRTAHAQVQALRAAHRRVPAGLRVLDAEYHQRRRRLRGADSGGRRAA